MIVRNRFGILVIMLLLTRMVSAQSPERFSFQSVVRNASGQVVSSQSVGIRLSVLQGSVSGSSVYVETHVRTTTSTGLITLEIGSGTPVTGSLGAIDWSKGPFFLKTETDPAGGSSYQLVGTTQLLSVPYSLFAQSASLQVSTLGDTLYSGKQYVIVPGLSNANAKAQGDSLAVLTTTPATNVAEKTAVVGGQVSSAGGGAVTTRGICYSTSGSPSTSNFTVTVGSGTGSFQATLTNLSAATMYYARSFAINAYGTSYGNQVMFTTTGPLAGTCTGTVRDIDGNDYAVVQIGSQCWMKENLRVTRFRDGWPISLDSSGGVTGDGAGQTWGKLSTSARTIYGHDKAIVSRVGYLYNKFAVFENRGICPIGWHVPNPSEWISLASFLGGELVAGGKMKITTTAFWKAPNSGADNSSGFTAYPSGFRSQFSGIFIGNADMASFWAYADQAFAYELLYNSSAFTQSTTLGYGGHEQNGLAIRCIRD